MSAQVLPIHPHLGLFIDRIEVEPGMFPSPVGRNLKRAPVLPMPESSLSQQKGTLILEPNFSVNPKSQGPVQIQPLRAFKIWAGMFRALRKQGTRGEEDYDKTHDAILIRVKSSFFP